MAAGRKLASFVHVNGEVYGPDSDVPADVAKEIVNPKAWADGGDVDSDDEGDKGYGGKNVAELTALAEERELEVEGTGKDGKVVKADLVAALEAHDADNA